MIKIIKKENNNNNMYSVPFALNVLIASYNKALGLRTPMVSGKLKIDWHSKTLSTPAVEHALVILQRSFVMPLPLQ